MFRPMKLLQHYHCRGEHMFQRGPQDHPMRESADFHTNKPTFVGTRLRENPGRNPENTPWARTMLQPLHPYGAVLNLDVIDFRNLEKLIDEWVAAIKIAATTLELDKENFIKLVELSLEGFMKIGWDNTHQLTLKPVSLPEIQRVQLQIG
ncbi:UNVERIFIED_CONTAM: hypothetical protein Sangu_0202100 [Sesamum angustifolium]|uniref:Uncharacterized protein n=1 Tax=Sesamum angustifolium TaxID=2727405 RepID=A0AAW2RPM0_9LAMI